MSQLPRSSHPRVRIVSVCVGSNCARRPDTLRSRADLLLAVTEAIAAEPGWTGIDAVLWPGGYLKVSDQYGALRGRERAARLQEAELSQWTRAAAAILAEASPGALVVIGVDSTRLSWEFRGDELVTAWSADGLVGVARKIFPTDGDTTGAGLRPYLLYAHDSADPRRIVDLPSGARATLCVCYDAFLFNELVLGPTAKRGAMRYIAHPTERWEWATPEDRAHIIDAYWGLHTSTKPTVALIGIHRFKQPGADLRWQRHGIATASAGVGGGLAVGAAHFTRQLPTLAQFLNSPLASAGAPKNQIQLGLNRGPCALNPIAALMVEATHKRPAALVRLYDS